jgi:hypothetical protein
MSDSLDPSRRAESERRAVPSRRFLAPQPPSLPVVLLTSTPRCLRPANSHLRSQLTEEEIKDRKRWQLESEITAIDRYADALGKPLGGAGSSGPGTTALSSKGLVALAAARRQAEEAMAAAAAEGGAPM